MKNILGILLVVIMLTPASLAAETAGNVPDSPFAWLLFHYDGWADFDAGPAYPDAEGSMMELDLQSPVYVNRFGDAFGLGRDDVMASGGIRVMMNRLAFDGIDMDDLTLYGIAFPIDIMAEYEQWWAAVNIFPGIYTDFESVSGDDFRTQASLLGIYRFAPHLQFAAGLAYDADFGRDVLYPMGGVIWRPDQYWELNIVFPMPRITYAPSRDLAFTFEMYPAGNIWNLEDDTGSAYDFKLETIRGGFGVEYQLTRNIWLNAMAGVSTGRSYEFRMRSGAPVSADIDDTYFLRIGILVR